MLFKNAKITLRNFCVRLNCLGDRRTQTDLNRMLSFRAGEPLPYVIRFLNVLYAIKLRRTTLAAILMAGDTCSPW